jgi:hypothetical protein
MLVPHCSHSSASSNNLKMESDCVDPCSCDPVMSSAVSSSASVKNDTSSGQDCILQILTLISNQMVTLDRDFQEILPLRYLCLLGVHW